MDDYHYPVAPFNQNHPLCVYLFEMRQIEQPPTPAPGPTSCLRRTESPSTSKMRAPNLARGCRGSSIPVLASCPQQQRISAVAAAAAAAAAAPRSSGDWPLCPCLEAPGGAWRRGAGPTRGGGEVDFRCRPSTLPGAPSRMSSPSARRLGLLDGLLGLLPSARRGAPVHLPPMG